MYLIMLECSSWSCLVDIQHHRKKSTIGKAKCKLSKHQERLAELISTVSNERESRLNPKSYGLLMGPLENLVL